MDVFFYEAFSEEEEALRRYLPANISAGFMKETIQESGHALPAAALISIRTQSFIPLMWGSHITGILTRSTGYDHITAYLTLQAHRSGQATCPCTAAGQWPNRPCCYGSDS